MLLFSSLQSQAFSTPTLTPQLKLIIESYKIPWLIWIQFLVTILFIILLFGISVCTTDSSASTSISASTSRGRAAIAPPPNVNNPSSSQRGKEEEIQQVERNGEGSEETIIDDDQDRDESLLNDSVLQRLFKHPTHPCNYLGLAKQSFLKCLGLDTSSESPSNKKHRKQD